ESGRGGSRSGAQGVPGGGGLLGVANYLIYLALSSIGRALFRVGSNFLPALRERLRPSVRRFGLQPVDRDGRRRVRPQLSTPTFLRSISSKSIVAPRPGSVGAWTRPL